ncbi:MFS transporter [Catenulispora sp. NL8]|uniref:MFS transporter n=1 Tax=Catenulispora pinistramenti TaxID=2705254 RepID=A0ABS5KKV4_9ACTN|nr:MFS transporter [Catenulispora pinistramenti]MBS2546672.1 MFS transporter [Catenulispora pinistramenti]
MLNPRIYLLALGTFTVGTEGYVVAGVLPQVARDLHTTVPVVGQLVTVFALAYAILGPPLIARAHALPPRRLLVGAALLFAAANAVAAVAPGLAVLVAARIAAAAGAALFMAPAASIAAALAPPDKLPKAIAVTATGNALALTAGAPLGTVIASALGWRAAFWFVTALALVTAALVAVLLPDVRPATAEAARRADLARSPGIRWAAATTFALFLAAYTLYTYLSPVVAAATGRGSGAVALLMVTFGAGGLIGGRLIGHILTRTDLARTLRYVLGVVASVIAIIAALTATGGHQDPNLVLLFPAMLILGAAWWSGGISQQTRFVLLAPGQRSTALSLHFSAQFLGVATAGALGGLTLTTFSATGIPVVAVAIALLAQPTVRKLTSTRPEAATRQNAVVISSGDQQG